MTLDPREFNGARWWTTDEIAGALGEPFDPHFRRFMAKPEGVVQTDSRG
jgi:8-oxo-dGTP diphosphatase